MSSGICKRCLGRGRPEHFGSEPICAFPTMVFDGNNWQCQTMNELRAAVDHGVFATRTSAGRVYGEDCSVGVLAFDRGFVVMSWYKDRGRTDQAVVMADDHEQVPEPLTLAVAESVLDQWRRRTREDT